MMMETIEAALAPTFEPGFSTPEEAIAFSKLIAKARESKDMASCIGQSIRVADWRDDAIFLHLDNRKVLHFGCEQSVVDLTIEDDANSNVVSGSRTPDEVLIRLDGDELLWKRGKLMRSLQGNAVRRIQAGQTLYFLYVANVGILFIRVLINRLTSRPFLYWTLTD